MITAFRTLKIVPFEVYVIDRSVEVGARLAAVKAAIKALKGWHV